MHPGRLPHVCSAYFMNVYFSWVCETHTIVVRCVTRITIHTFFNFTGYLSCINAFYIPLPTHKQKNKELHPTNFVYVCNRPVTCKHH